MRAPLVVVVDNCGRFLGFFFEAAAGANPWGPEGPFWLREDVTGGLPKDKGAATPKSRRPSSYFTNL